MSDTQTLIDNLRAQLNGPRDGALLRYGLANALLQAGDPGGAAQAAASATRFDPEYTAAWKLLGKARAEAGDNDGAIDAYLQGIDAAESQGDIQAGKEMRVFLRRLERARDSDP